MSGSWSSWSSSFRKSPRKQAAEQAAEKAAEKAAKAVHASRLNRLQECGEFLAQYLAKDPENKRTLLEQEEYHLLKKKVDQGSELNSVEKNRLRVIITNVQRRDYKLSLSKDLAIKASQAEQDKNLGKAENKDSGEGVDSSPIGSHSSPTSARNQTPKKKTTQTSQPPVDHITTAPRAKDEEIIFEDAEDSDVAMIDADDEEEEIEAPDCLWQYSVYRTDTGDPGGCTDGVFLSTYLKKTRAEARVREEIRIAHSSLWDRTRMEVRATFDNGGFRGQSLEFASGRVVDVRIEKSLIEGQSTVRAKKGCRQKLEYLPVKVYVILEDISEIDTPDKEPSPESDDPFSRDEEPVEVDNTIPTDSLTIQPVWKECFVLRNHANAQASRRMMAHLTSHLPEEIKFDLGMTGSSDTDARHYLHVLEEGERLYNKTMALPHVGADGRKRQVTIRVMELLLRGPRN